MSGGGGSRRKPSQDTTRRSEDRDRSDFTRRPSATASISNHSESTTTGPPTQSTTAGSGMIIPNKSTIEEEYIEVPYGREQRESGATIDTPSAEGLREFNTGDDSASEYGALSPRSPPAGGLAGLSSRLRDVQDEDENDAAAAGNKSGDDFYDKYGRSSVASDRSLGNSAPGRMASRASASDEQEKIRRDYEFKIATMQSKITELQRQVDDSANTASKYKEAESRAQQLEEDLDAARRVRHSSSSFLPPH